MSFAIPDPRWEEPNLLVPGKKPVGPVAIDWSHPISTLLGDKKGAVLLPAHGHPNVLGDEGLNTNFTVRPNTEIRPHIGGENLRSPNVDSNNGGVDFGLGSSGRFTFDGSNEMTLMTVIGLEDPRFNDCEIARETTSADKGISLSIRNGPSVRGLITTTGSDVWTIAHDKDVSAYEGKICIIGMRWSTNANNSNRELFIAELGKEFEVLDAQFVSGTVAIVGDANLLVGSGTHPDSGDCRFSQYEVLMSRKWISDLMLDNFCHNPYQFLIPA